MPTIDSSIDVRARVREAVQAGDIKSGSGSRLTGSMHAQLCYNSDCDLQQYRW
jgi:hypothetical protein